MSEIIAEGKTKRILATKDPDFVLIQSKDDITAGDGAKHDQLEGKAVYSTATTCNVFRYLKKYNVQTHFVEQVDERTFRALRLEMIPIEVVARRFAAGSYLQRNPDVAEGTEYDDIVIELYEKNDADHDPLMVVDALGSRILYFDAHKPLAQGCLRESTDREEAGKLLALLQEIIPYTHTTFYATEDAWNRQDVKQIDFKLEFGLSRQAGLYLGDVIDNDSWRIWPGGNKQEMKDKQVYRNLEEVTPEALATLVKNYAWVAEATSRF